ncbi:MAG: ABC transporter permease [Firmicutes bacterium]|nr:ABC transporter permease [Bacillota bacterium]
MLWQMAVKNVFRNRKRTMLTLAAVFWGVMMMITANGFNKGLEWQAGNLYIKTESSMLKVVAPDFSADTLENPLDYPLENYQPILRDLKNNKYVKATSPRITFHGSLANGIDEIRATGIGVEAMQEDAVFKRSDDIAAGSFLEPNQDGVVIGYKLARLLELNVGDTVTIIAQAAQMGQNASDLEIKGLINTGNPALDGTTFFVPLKFAQDFLSYKGITDIAVSLRNPGSLSRFTNEFRPKNNSGPFKIMTWRDFAQSFIKIVEFRGQMINYLTIMILLMAAAGIMNTMLMAMMERRHEIGNLMAMGVRNEEIILLFVIEGAVIGVMGSAAAMVLGTIIVSYFQAYGIPLGGLADRIGNTQFGAGGKLYAYLEWGNVLLYFFTGIGVAIISGIYPAWKSTQLRPVEAIRDQRG